MEFKIVEKKKGVLEAEFDEKEVAVMLANELSKKGVDAYWYDPHPLLASFRLHIADDDAEAALKAAVTALGKDWSAFRKAVEAKLK
ncbi:MAG: hypothetical protein ABIH11_08380 [Candidatus Altiarchaeota archaeon]